MQTQNPYEKIRYPGIAGENHKLVTPYKVIDIYASETEVVQALVAHDTDGRYTFGYRITFNNGRQVDKSPDLEAGYFSSLNDAVLYFLGMIISYRQWFSAELVAEARRQTVKYGQYTLF